MILPNPPRDPLLPPGQKAPLRLLGQIWDAQGRIMDATTGEPVEDEEEPGGPLTQAAGGVSQSTAEPGAGSADYIDENGERYVRV